MERAARLHALAHDRRSRCRARAVPAPRRGSAAPGPRRLRPAQPGEDPQAVAAEQLRKDGVQVLHTIGGDDTSIAAARLAQYLHSRGYDLTVVGLPKTIDNDIIPIGLSLGATTAVQHGARFLRQVVAEATANPRMLIVHEVHAPSCRAGPRCGRAQRRVPVSPTRRAAV